MVSCPGQSGRQRPSCRFLALAYAAVLGGCAQLERAPEPEPQPAETTAAPTAPVPAPPAASRDVGPKSKERGRISMYGSKFSGRKTASGETFDPSALTMAHRTLPFGTRVRVTNLENQRSVDVVVNDRGPFVAGRIADLSEAAAQRLGMVTDGVVEALLDTLEPAKAR